MILIALAAKVHVALLAEIALVAVVALVAEIVLAADIASHLASSLVPGSPSARMQVTTLNPKSSGEEAVLIAPTAG